MTAFKKFFSTQRLAGLFCKASEKMSKAFRLVLIILSSLNFISCSYVNACYDNIKGVFLFESGKYSQSIVSYNGALENSGNRSDYIYYNLSRVYRDMGENQPAGEILSGLSLKNVKNLEYNVNYLKGVIACNEGRYDDAVLFFKKSIKIDNSDINLIKGLELAFLKLENRKGRQKNDSDTGENSSSSSGSDLPDSAAGYEENRESRSGRIKSASDIIDYMFTEEVSLWLGNGNTDQENISDW